MKIGGVVDVKADNVESCHRSLCKAHTKSYTAQDSVEWKTRNLDSSYLRVSV